MLENCNDRKLKYITAAIALALLGAVTILWSWNTIAGVLDGPEIQAKHAIAALLLLGVARTILSPRRRHTDTQGYILMKIDLLEYRPPRIAMLLLALAAATNLTVPLETIGPESLQVWAPAVGIAGFCVMMQAWWQFRKMNVAICPTAETEALITDGIYRFTRNPMYLGMLMMLTAIAMFIGTLPFYLAAAALFAILNFVFCPYEENKLVRTFGSPFRQYRMRVRRWL